MPASDRQPQWRHDDEALWLLLPLPLLLLTSAKTARRAPRRIAYTIDWGVCATPAWEAEADDEPNGHKARRRCPHERGGTAVAALESPSGTSNATEDDSLPKSSCATGGMCELK